MSNEVARSNQPPTILKALEQMVPEIQRALPKHLNADRIARIVTTEMRKTPKLAACTPESFFGSLLTASALGLEPSVNGECYLIPYEDRRNNVIECQLVIGYQGVVKLFWQHPLAARISAEFVCENDHFVFDKGLTPKLEHRPADGDRGEVVGYYAIAGLSTGAQMFDYFSPEEIKTLRQGKVGPSKSFKGGDPQKWMERKTALKQVLKLMPKSTTLSYATQVDETVGSMDAGKAIAQGASLPELEHSHVPESEEGVDAETGEVLEAELVEPPVDPWTNKPVTR